MIHDHEIKVGDQTVTIKGTGHRGRPAKGHSKPEVTAKVVAPPEKKAPRKSTGTQSK